MTLDCAHDQLKMTRFRLIISGKNFGIDFFEAAFHEYLMGGR